MAQHCVSKGHRVILITAPPFHALRAFASAISAAVQSGHTELKLYHFAGELLDWNATVLHSQGAVFAPRKDLIDGELDRITRYTATGDILEPSVLLAYLDGRDST